MMPFHKAPLSFIVGWPLLILAVIGLFSIAGLAFSLLWWLIGHVEFVP